MAFQFTKQIKNDSFEKEFLIGFVGNLEIHKGLKDLHFLASSMQCDPRVTILLVGEVKGYRNKKLLKSFKNFKNIKLLGKLSKREVLLFYKKIDAFGFAKLSRRQSKSSFRVCSIW